MITLETLKFLQSQAGFELLEELKTADLSEANTLRLLTQLRKRYSPENAAAALETARLRIKAKEKLGKYYAEDMFFTSEALEQASSREMSLSRIAAFAGETYSRIADLGCGIGADTIHLVTKKKWHPWNVIAIDRDPLRLAIAKANVEDLEGNPVQFLQADLTSPLPFTFKDVEAAFFDPARRTNGKRIFSVKDYIPSLDIIKTWHFKSLIVKLSPGVEIAELEPYGGSVNFASVNGELKEAQLLVGEIDPQYIRALIANEGRTEILSENGIVAPPLREPIGYLYEPDPAVIRTGLLGELAERLEIPMYRMDETIAYLTADTYVKSILARAWIIDDWMPFNLKKLRAYLRERNVGRVTVKKRGSPITPEELIAQLKLSGDGEERVVVLTHVMGQPAVLICRMIERT